MTNFQGIVIALLAVVAARTDANGHDIRNDWTRAERAVVVTVIIVGMAAVGIFAARWMFV